MGNGYRLVGLAGMPARQYGSPVKFALGKKIGSQARFHGSSKSYPGNSLAEYMPHSVDIEVTRIQANTIRVTCYEVDSRDATGFTSISTLFIKGNGNFMLAGDARCISAFTKRDAEGKPSAREEVIAHPFVVTIERKPKSPQMTLSLFSFNDSFDPSKDPSCYMPVELREDICLSNGTVLRPQERYEDD